MSQSLTGRVAGVFATRAAVFAIGLVSTYLLARILGPDGRGAYYLALLLPVTLVTFGQLGIPAALVFFAGRDVSLDGLRTTSAVLAIVLSVVTVGPALLARDFLVTELLPGTTSFSITIAIAAVPFLLICAFTYSILVGRLAIRTVNLLALGQAAASLVVWIAFVGLAGWGVDGAVAAYTLVVAGASVAGTVAVMRLAKFHRPSLEPLASMLRYSVRVYPGTLATFFGYRADIFLLSVITGSASAVGLYGLAVGIAELLFYVADSVYTAFFPHVAATDRMDADRQMPEVCRTTLLVTVLAALAMIPFAVIGIRVTLPAFVESIAPFVVILPGIVALGLSKVLNGYLSGIGRPGTVGYVSVASLVVNVVANILLIPPLGIVGAALASTISYSVNASLMVGFAARLANVSPRAIIIPTAGDARRVLRIGLSMATGRFLGS